MIELSNLHCIKTFCCIKFGFKNDSQIIISMLTDTNGFLQRILYYVHRHTFTTKVYLRSWVAFTNLFKHFVVFYLVLNWFGTTNMPKTRVIFIYGTVIFVICIYFVTGGGTGCYQLWCHLEQHQVSALSRLLMVQPSFTRCLWCSTYAVYWEHLSSLRHSQCSLPFRSYSSQSEVYIQPNWYQLILSQENHWF